LNDARSSLPQLRELANQAFSRAAGAPLIGGNSARLLEDARENYPAWLEAISTAKRHVHFESYYISEDEIGLQFADALVARAREGVAVRLIYDWLGNFAKASRRFWRFLAESGVQVRCYNPPRLESPLGWVSRDHRKMLSVDGEVGFITGMCVAREWAGDPGRSIEPWRDTGVEIRGCAVAEIERAFRNMWSSLGEAVPGEAPEVPPAAGEVNLRIVATEPATAGMLRLDQLVAALARERLWLTDAYYAGTPSYVQALRAAAQDGVDVRLLVPNATDIPLLRPLSRTGYRSLLEAGVRVFEWNGTMLHAKTAVTDGRWARVGSTNLNIASWFGNCELDAVVEDAGFAGRMEEMYLRDLGNATEIVLDARRKLSTPGQPHQPRRPRVPPDMRTRRGSAGRAAAGAVRIGNAIGAAFTGRRVLGPVEARLTLVSGVALCTFALLIGLVPHLLTYPVAALAAWGGIALIYRGYRLRRRSRND
jgi:cardiolipin synthase